MGQLSEPCECGLDERWQTEGTGGLAPDAIERVETTGRVHRVIPKRGPAFLHICGRIGVEAACDT
jgi:hypothetical protein